MRVLIIFLIMFSVIFAGSLFVNITSPLNTTSNFGENLSISSICIGNETTWNGFIFVNNTLFTNFSVINNTIQTNPLNLRSAVYNISMLCNSTYLFNTTNITIGYYEIRTYTTNYTSPDLTIYSDFTGFIDNFFEDNLKYFAPIFVFGIALFYTRKLSDACIVSSIAIVGIFFISGGSILFAGGLLVMGVGFLLKQAGG